MNVIVEHILRITHTERLIILAELLVIGLVVYAILNFLEGTRGERLFRGMIFVLLIGSLVLNLVVENVRMDQVAFLYKGFLIVVAIIAIIAFQPEIRRALIRIGQTPFFSTRSQQQLTRSVEEIVMAVSQMAATRTGAIIVIEQQVGLGEFIETGVRLNAKITSELIKTIFYPGTPLHDMAMVIQADRIVAARVQLPLAESGGAMAGALGSRHRAATGLTSSADAIVIVVSEETGIISLAMNGQLIRNVSEVQLRRYLTTALVEATLRIAQLRSGQKNEADQMEEE